MGARKIFQHAFGDVKGDFTDSLCDVYLSIVCILTSGHFIHSRLFKVYIFSLSTS